MRTLKWNQYGIIDKRFKKQDLTDNLEVLREKQAKYLAEQQYYVSKPAQTRAYRIQILKKMIDDYPDDT